MDTTSIILKGTETNGLEGPRVIKRLGDRATPCWKFTVVHDDRALMCHGNVAGHTETLSWCIGVFR
jgi:hypothetical protein